MKARPESAANQLASPRRVTGATVIRFGLSGALTMTLVFIAAWAAA